jgi:hypothetical protein
MEAPASNPQWLNGEDTSASGSRRGDDGRVCGRCGLAQSYAPRSPEHVNQRMRAMITSLATPGSLAAARPRGPAPAASRRTHLGRGAVAAQRPHAQIACASSLRARSSVEIVGTGGAGLLAYAPLGGGSRRSRRRASTVPRAAASLTDMMNPASPKGKVRPGRCCARDVI